LVRAVRPDLDLESILTPCELNVLRLRVDGHPQGEIAAIRNTAARTVSNQIASAYAKLGVSGRPELLAALASGRWQHTPLRLVS
jgi:DNA-binding CsgD family transcriptional regulator